MCIRDRAKDADALTSAFEEFTNRKLKTKEKPSVLEQLNKLKELVAAILPDKMCIRDRWMVCRAMPSACSRCTVRSNRACWAWV